MAAGYQGCASAFPVPFSSVRRLLMTR